MSGGFRPPPTPTPARVNVSVADVRSPSQILPHPPVLCALWLAAELPGL